MMARAHPSFTLRPFLIEDAPLLAEIFRASIEELTVEDYGAGERQAWASAADDEAAFAQRLADQLTVVATMNGSPVGFASLANGETLDLLYVHPAVAGQGVGAMLLDALERLSVARGAKRLIVDVSDTALDFFTKRGFEAQQRNTVRLGGYWLANTTMEKKLAAKEPEKDSEKGAAE
jgi:putative acetyltransferase